MLVPVPLEPIVPPAGFGLVLVAPVLPAGFVLVPEVLVPVPLVSVLEVPEVLGVPVALGLVPMVPVPLLVLLPELLS